MKDIQAGDYFLMPFKGKRRDLLVKAVQPHSALGSGQWQACDVSGKTHSLLLTSCRRCSPSLARRILGKIK